MKSPEGMDRTWHKNAEAIRLYYSIVIVLNACHRSPGNIAVLDSMPTEIAVIDSNGVILTINEHWKKFAAKNGIDPAVIAPNTDLGSNYLAVCQAAMATFSPGTLAAYDAIRAVLDGLIPSFHMEYQCHSATQQRWFAVSSLLQNAKGGAVIMHTDISERKLQEHQIREQTLLDTLTKLPNWILFKDRLQQAMVTSKRSGRHAALLSPSDR